MNENPWHRLPDKPPYVLPEDEEQVLDFNTTANQQAREKHVLHLDLIPEPFVGRPDARVVLLGNNPGVKSAETKAYRLKSGFAERMRNNLLHRLSDDYPFLYLDPDPDIPPASRCWWEYKLKSLFGEFGTDRNVARDVLAQAILAVEFFPYVSHRYRHGQLSLPSQQYSFGLVRNAVTRRAVIVLTRGVRRWLKAVKELEGYHRLVRLKEVQRAPISRGNCGDHQYEEIVRAIKATST